MRILALDPSPTAASAAVVEDGHVLSCQWSEPGSRLADGLMPAVLAAIHAAGGDFFDIDAIAVPVGPGGFSAVRVGVAAARGLALAADRPVLAVGTLDVVAQAAGADPAAPLAVVLDAHRGELFCKLFDGDLSPLGEAVCESPEGVARLLPDSIRRLAGDGTGLLAHYLSKALTRTDVQPDAVAVAEVAFRRLAQGDRPRPGHTLTPVYLRAPDARLSAGRPLVGAAA